MIKACVQNTGTHTAFSYTASVGAERSIDVENVAPNLESNFAWYIHASCNGVEVVRRINVATLHKSVNAIHYEIHGMQVRVMYNV